VFRLPRRRERQHDGRRAKKAYAAGHWEVPPEDVSTKLASNLK
jgi:hypothetical protein